MITRKQIEDTFGKADFGDDGELLEWLYIRVVLENTLVHLGDGNVEYNATVYYLEDIASYNYDNEEFDAKRIDWVERMGDSDTFFIFDENDIKKAEMDIDLRAILIVCDTNKTNEDKTE